MTSERIKQIQETTAYPESVSVNSALLQVWNECGQEQSKDQQKMAKMETALKRIIEQNECCKEDYVISQIIEIAKQALC